MKIKKQLFIFAVFAMAMVSQAALTWTGASDGATLFDEGNWLDDNGAVPAADTINPGTNVTAITGGLILIDSGTGTPDSAGSGHFVLGIGNDLELGGGKVLSSTSLKVDNVFGVSTSPVTVAGASTISFNFFRDVDVTLDGASTMRLTGTGDTMLEGCTVNVLDTESLIQLKDKKYSAFDTLYSSKVTFKGAALEFGTAAFVIESGDNAFATAFNGSLGVQIQMLELTPGAAPEIYSFSADSTNVYAGETVTLSWEVLGANTLGIDQGVGDVTGMVSTQVVVTADTIYTFTADNGNGTTNASVHIALSTDPPLINYFVADKTVVGEGETVTLSWDVLGADTLGIDQGVGDVTGLTSTQVVVNADTTYTLTADNGNGPTNATVHVTLNTDPPLINYFIADKTAVNIGETVTLSWDVLGADTLGINQGVGDVTGLTSTQVVVNADTTYTLTADNGHGTTNALVAVSIRSGSAVSTTIVIGDATGLISIQGDAGGTPTDNNGLSAENGNMWGFVATKFKSGLRYSTYSNLVDGSALPSTIQAGTYTFEARVGNNGLRPFNGLIDLTSSDGGNASGMVAGFFETLGAAAANSKANMYNEFNGLSGVTYTQPTETDPAEDTFTTWTFIWDVAEGSTVIGKDLYFGAYIKIPSADGNAWFDDSTLLFEPLGSGDPVEDLAISGPVSGGTEMVLSWTGESGSTYGVETNSNLILGSGWAMWITSQIGTGGTISVTNTIGPNQTFYRVITEE